VFGDGKDDSSSPNAGANIIASAELGRTNDTEATSDTGTFSITALLKRLLNTHLSAISNAYASNSVYRSLAASAGANVKGSAGTLLSLSCSNLNSSVRYLQIFNSTGSPTGTPLISYPIFGEGFTVLDEAYFTKIGISFSTGITWGFSTAAGTYTAGSSSDVIMEIIYK